MARDPEPARVGHVAVGQGAAVHLGQPTRSPAALAIPRHVYPRQVLVPDREAMHDRRRGVADHRRRVAMRQRGFEQSEVRGSRVQRAVRRDRRTRRVVGGRARRSAPFGSGRWDPRPSAASSRLDVMGDMRPSRTNGGPARKGSVQICGYRRTLHPGFRSAPHAKGADRRMGCRLSSARTGRPTRPAAPRGRGPRPAGLPRSAARAATGTPGRRRGPAGCPGWP